MRKLVPGKYFRTKVASILSSTHRLGLSIFHMILLRENLYIVDIDSSGDAQSMQDGAAGHLSGVSAMATVRRGENQFHRSQGQELVFRKPMAA